MKIFQCIILILLLGSCGSKENTTYPKDTSKVSQTSPANILKPQDTLKANQTNTTNNIKTKDTCELVIKRNGTIDENHLQSYYACKHKERLEQIKQELQIDSIASHSIDYYLDNSKIEIAAKRFYNGEIYPSDDSTTFDLLNILTKNDTIMGPFNKYLFDYVCSISDGALGEIMGFHSLNAINNNTEIYIKSGIANQLSNISFELHFEDNIDKELNNLKELWKSKCSENLHTKIDSLIVEIKKQALSI